MCANVICTTSACNWGDLTLGLLTSLVKGAGLLTGHVNGAGLLTSHVKGAGLLTSHVNGAGFQRGVCLNKYDSEERDQNGRLHGCGILVDTVSGR